MLKDRLKELRSDRSISQRELASALKLSPSTIAMYEVGKREPDSEILNKIADFFNVTTDFLLGRVDGKNEGQGTTPANDEVNEILETLHKRPEMTRRYVSLVDKDLEEVHATASPLNRLLPKKQRVRKIKPRH